MEQKRTEMKAELAKIKSEIDHITEAMFNPLVIDFVNRDYPENEPIKDIPHLNRLARVVLPLLKEQQLQLERLLTPPSTSITMPKKRYSMSYEERFELKRTANSENLLSTEERTKRLAQSKAAKTRHAIKLNIKKKHR